MLLRPRLLLLLGLFVHSALLAAPAATGARPKSVLPFIADDYDRALRVAREQQVPLFVESWAPW